MSGVVSDLAKLFFTQPPTIDHAIYNNLPASFTFVFDDGHSVSLPNTDTCLLCFAPNLSP